MTTEKKAQHQRQKKKNREKKREELGPGKTLKNTDSQYILHVHDIKHLISNLLEQYITATYISLQLSFNAVSNAAAVELRNTRTVHTHTHAHCLALVQYLRTHTVCARASTHTRAFASRRFDKTKKARCDVTS